MNTFSKAVLEERRKRGLSREQLALDSGMCAATIFKFEKGRCDISLTKAYALAKALNLKLDSYGG